MWFVDSLDTKERYQHLVVQHLDKELVRYGWLMLNASETRH